WQPQPLAPFFVAPALFLLRNTIRSLPMAKISKWFIAVLVSLWAVALANAQCPGGVCPAPAAKKISLSAACGACAGHPHAAPVHAVYQAYRHVGSKRPAVWAVLHPVAFVRCRR